MPINGQPQAEVERALRLLTELIRVHGYTRKNLDLKLGRGAGYTSQVLSGRLDLKYSHVLEILAALDLAPATFFRALFGRDSEGATAARDEPTQRT